MRLSSVLCGKTHRETPCDRRDWPGGFAAPGRQENDVGQASDGLKSSSPDDGGLDLAVDVFFGGIAGIKPLGGKNAGQMGLQDFAKVFEGLQPTASGPGYPGTKQGLGIFPGPSALMNLLVAFFHAPSAGGPDV